MLYGYLNTCHVRVYIIYYNHQKLNIKQRNIIKEEKKKISVEFKKCFESM